MSRNSAQIDEAIVSLLEIAEVRRDLDNAVFRSMNGTIDQSIIQDAVTRITDHGRNAIKILKSVM